MCWSGAVLGDIIILLSQSCSSGADGDTRDDATEAQEKYAKLISLILLILLPCVCTIAHRPTKFDRAVKRELCSIITKGWLL